MLFVHPKATRRGIGQALVTIACSLADEKGLTTFVESSPKGESTYERCGFEARERVRLPTRKWTGEPELSYRWLLHEAESTTKG